MKDFDEEEDEEEVSLILDERDGTICIDLDDGETFEDYLIYRNDFMRLYEFEFDSPQDFLWKFMGIINQVKEEQNKRAEENANSSIDDT